MKKSSYKNTTFLHFENLSKHTSIFHLISTREGGFSKNEYKGLNLSYKTGDDAKDVDDNYQLLKKYILQGQQTKLLLPFQTHSTRIGIVENGDEKFEDTDALITNKKNIFLGVLTADCVPILLFDTKNRAIAAIHAGWRGTFGEIITKTIALMQTQFQTNAEDLIAGIGPSISGANYEIGKDVIEPIQTGHPLVRSKILLPHSNPEKAYLDLWNWNKLQLIAAGVLEKNIEISSICTFSNANEFYSYRAQGIKSGRFITGIKLN